MSSARANWFVGTGASAVAAELAAFAAKHGVDEVMISPIAGSYDDEPMDAAAGRAQTLELLAAVGHWETAAPTRRARRVRLGASLLRWTTSDAPADRSSERAQPRRIHARRTLAVSRVAEPRLRRDGLQRRDLDDRRVALGHGLGRDAEALHPLVVLGRVFVADPVEPRVDGSGEIAAVPRSTSHCSPSSPASRWKSRAVVLAQVPDLRGGRLAHHQRATVAPQEPDRHRVRKAVAADRAEPGELLALQPSRARGRAPCSRGRRRMSRSFLPRARR